MQSHFGHFMRITAFTTIIVAATTLLEPVRNGAATASIDGIERGKDRAAAALLAQYKPTCSGGCR